MIKKQKLELTWVGKENRPRLEPRILLEVPEQSYHAGQRVTDLDLFDNRLIFGDNLLALKALEQEFAGKVKCVFIDPPYNTGSAFKHYDDGLEHSIWLSLIRDRIELIYRLLSEDGSLWITIDDNEAHYLKILCDEIFGRDNFVANVVWQKRIGPDNRLPLGDAHDHILVFAVKKAAFQDTANRIPLSTKQIAEFKNPDNDPRGPWTSSSNFSAQGFRPNQMYKIRTPGGAEYSPPQGRCWVTIESEFKRLLAEGRMWFGQDGKGMPRKKTYLHEQEGRMSWTWWPNDEVGNTQESKKEIISLFGSEDAFDTPKPERLMYRIIHIATSPGDIVLDSFAGSGTTGAVAHKMGRRWIMVELHDHCHTHIMPRLKKVVDGEDKGGVTEATGWSGGGGFRYFKLAPSLLDKDKWGREVISKAYNAEMLAEALCKIEGFTYSPSDSVYWQHGTSTERDFIYVTTQTLSPEQLSSISEEVGEGRTLLVLCAAFRGNSSAWPNLTVKKIPNHIRERCEWGHDDYSLNVENLPKAPPATKVADKALSRSASLPSLFDLSEDDQ
jgi:adenine-specific DNA-methyltransferase